MKWGDMKSLSAVGEMQDGDIDYTEWLVKATPDDVKVAARAALRAREKEGR